MLPDEALIGHFERYIAHKNDAIDLKEGVILHLDQDGNPLEMEIIDASKFISLDEVSFSLPRVNLSGTTQYVSN